MDHDVFQWPALQLPKASAEFRLAFCTACLVGFITHLYLLTNILPNHDSIGAIYSDNNMLSSGRWSSWLLSAFSTDFQLPVVIGLISILALAVTAGLTVRVLELTHRGNIIMSAALLVTFPSLSGIFSYLFTADAYCLALLLNALAAYCAKRYRWGWVAAVLMIAAACGTYQSFICYAIGLFLFDCILLLLEGEPLIRVIQKGLIYIGICIGALGLYYLILNALLLITHTELADYQGLNGMGLDTILAIPNQIPKAYVGFFQYFHKPSHLNSFYRLIQWADSLFLVVTALWLAVLKRLYRDIPRMLLVLAGLGLVPLALNFITVLIAETEAHHLMVYSFVLAFLLVIKLAELVMMELARSKKPAWAGILCTNLALCTLLAWCGFYTNNISYLRLQVRYDNSVALANRITARIEALEGYDENTPVALIGQLPINLYGRTVDAFSNFNPITGTDDILLLHSYSGRDVLKYCIGLHTPPSTKEQWDSLRSVDLISNMPCWPAAGSVVLHDGMAIVKLSDPV